MGQQQQTVTGSALRRLVLVLSVAALMAALMAASALSASASTQGKGPGLCDPLGSEVSKNAKLSGSVPDTFGDPPGRVNSADCAPGRTP